MSWITSGRGRRTTSTRTRSLHAASPELRAKLLPRAPRIDPAELIERCARATALEST
jgi:adenine C2-methylase RlmN of 23S rRNA A2503 and tRNA A37